VEFFYGEIIFFERNGFAWGSFRPYEARLNGFSSEWTHDVLCERLMLERILLDVVAGSIHLQNLSDEGSVSPATLSH
jgi:hypothetical protein